LVVSVTERILDLKNHFLIPAPGCTHTLFEEALIYICDHNEKGAVGLIVNRPMHLTVAKILEQSELIVQDHDLKNTPVYLGGPVQLERGFVLHCPPGHWKSTLTLTDSLGLTTSRDILDAINEGNGPDNALVILGYAGWEAGQLEQEIGSNLWLNVPADASILFNLPPSERLGAAVRQLGVDWLRISPVVGHA
jgi:putative transcriptional regulator